MVTYLPAIESREDILFSRYITLKYACAVKTEVPQGSATKVTVKEGAFPECGGGGYVTFVNGQLFLKKQLKDVLQLL